MYRSAPSIGLWRAVRPDTSRCTAGVTMVNSGPQLLMAGAAKQQRGLTPGHTGSLHQIFLSLSVIGREHLFGGISLADVNGNRAEFPR
jgi:hypothetical protein